MVVERYEGQKGVQSNNNKLRETQQDLFIQILFCVSIPSEIGYSFPLGVRGLL
jgi:hypothetical protein